MASTLDIVVRRGRGTSTFKFDPSTRPTLRALLCLNGPMMILSEDGSELYTDLNTLLVDLPSNCVTMREWTTDTLNAHTSVFLAQGKTIVADYEHRMSKETKGSAAYWELFHHQTNMKEVMARLSTP